MVTRAAWLNSPGKQEGPPEDHRYFINSKWTQQLLAQMTAQRLTLLSFKEEASLC